MEIATEFIDINDFDKMTAIFANNQEYIKQTHLCIDIFNRLKVVLSKEQKELLYQYEEATALKEVLQMQLMVKNIHAIILKN